MIEYQTLQSRVPQATIAAFVWKQGSRYIHDDPQFNKWESGSFNVSDTSLNAWLKVRRRLSEYS